MTTETDALRELHTTLIDSHDGYEQAKELVDSAQLRTLFADMEERRRKDADEVRAFLQNAGEELDEDGSILATAHRQFLGLKDMVTSSDEAIVAEVVRGERHLLAAYDAAIVPMTQGRPEYDFLNAQYAKLSARIDELEAKRDAE